jgi:hypothetical protein
LIVEVILHLELLLGLGHVLLDGPVLAQVGALVASHVATHVRVAKLAALLLALLVRRGMRPHHVLDQVVLGRDELVAHCALNRIVLLVLDLVVRLHVDLLTEHLVAVGAPEVLALVVLYHVLLEQLGVAEGVVAHAAVEKDVGEDIELELPLARGLDRLLAPNVEVVVVDLVVLLENLAHRLKLYSDRRRHEDRHKSLLDHLGEVIETVQIHGRGWIGWLGCVPRNATTP